jgi:hypothetical protein
MIRISAEPALRFSLDSLLDSAKFTIEIKTGFGIKPMEVQLEGKVHPPYRLQYATSATS